MTDSRNFGSSKQGICSRKFPKMGGRRVLSEWEERILAKFQGGPAIPGLLGNVLVYAHGEELKDDEKPQPRGLGPMETFEMTTIHALIRHLLGNGQTLEGLQVMVNDIQRVYEIGMYFCKISYAFGEFIKVVYPGHCGNDETSQVTIVLLTKTESVDEDSYIDTIFGAFLKSTVGVIVIASFQLFLDTELPKWQAMVDRLYEYGYVHPYIRIYCRIHKKACLKIKTAEELTTAAPYGGCNTLRSLKNCGHRSGEICRILPRSDGSDVCMEPCYLVCVNGHPCKMFCHEACLCEEDCAFLRPCGHLQTDKSVCRVSCNYQKECDHTCDKPCYGCLKQHDKEDCDSICDRLCNRGHRFPPHMCKDECPPCRVSLEQYTLKCGHKILKLCSELNDGDLDEFENYVCREICNRRFGVCNHLCPKFCFEECGLCEQLCRRPHPDCGHMMDVPCHSPIKGECQTRVISTSNSSCGHDVQIPCMFNGKLNGDEISNYCTVKCARSADVLECGHKCVGNCQICHQGRFHLRCKAHCEKLLFCSHECQISCPLVCPPCISKCMLTCEHYQCPYECGVPCNYKCPEPCPYVCLHLACTKTCGEVCNRVGCFEPCPKVLPCGHDCVGLCGELCPTACRVCTPDKLINILDSSGVPCPRYILLPTCGHTIDEESLSIWLSLESEDREIKLKCCPVCLKALDVTFRRYSKHVKAAWTQVQEVKARVYGNEMEIEEILARVRQEIQKRFGEKTEVQFKEFGLFVLNQAREPMKVANKSGVKFDSMYLDKAKFIAWTSGVWEKASTALSTYQHTWKAENVRKYEEIFDFICDTLKERCWPLHPNEMNSLIYELQRLADTELLLNRVALNVDDHLLRLADGREGTQKFNKAEAVLRTRKPYNWKLQDQFKEKFEEFSVVQKYTLEITDRERQEIVQAFGSRAGRWFKCPNGHVYVVTECGGVTEIARCNECGAIIGGENHQLLYLNELASEMDGADAPLYPTALIRNE